MSLNRHDEAVAALAFKSLPASLETASCTRSCSFSALAGELPVAAMETQLQRCVMPGSAFLQNEKMTLGWDLGRALLRPARSLFHSSQEHLLSWSTSAHRSCGERGMGWHRYYLGFSTALLGD